MAMSYGVCQVSLIMLIEDHTLGLLVENTPFERSKNNRKTTGNQSSSVYSLTGSRSREYQAVLMDRCMVTYLFFLEVNKTTS